VSLLRRQVFPLFGAAMTLAVGIALGAGPLQGGDGGDDSDHLESANAALSDQVSALEAGQDFSEAVAAGVAPGLLAERLRGRTVTLVLFPGVGDDRADAIRDAIDAAGGQTAVTVQLSDDLLDPGKKTYVASVAAGSLKGADDVAKHVTDDPYGQLGALIARAYVGRSAQLEIDDEATKIDSEIEGAKLVTVAGEPQQRGSVTVVLASGDHGAEVSTAAAHLISTSLIRALADASDGTVVVTPATGRAPGGLLDALEADASFDELRVSTLDVSDGSAAQVAAVFALAAAAADKAGSFGTDGSSVILPPGMPAPDTD
jgi:hypothetical protein